MGKFIGSTGLAYLWGKIKSALNTKQNTLVSGTNIKTINNESLLGSGNISIQGGGGDTNVIEAVKVNGTALTPDSNKAVNVIIPTALSGLTDDSTHRLVTDTEKAAWNGKAEVFTYDVYAGTSEEYLVANAGGYHQKIIESSAPYNAIHAAYQAGKIVFIKIFYLSADFPDMYIPLNNCDWAAYDFAIYANYTTNDINRNVIVDIAVNETRTTISYIETPLGTYNKPSGGIPASDIASGVIPTVPTTVSSFTNDSHYVASTAITTIVSMTQAQYDALATKDSNTLYIIPES